MPLGAASGQLVLIEDVTRERDLLEERDRLDETRAVAPLRPAPDAVEVDSSGATIDQVVDRVAEIVRRRSAG